MRNSSLLLLPLFGCAFASGPQDGSQPGRQKALRKQSQCQKWGVGATYEVGAGLQCDQVASEQRKYQEDEARRTRRAIEDSTKEEVRQAGADREARGDALAGDGEFLGQGWFCFEGEQEGVQVGGCNRDMIDCGVAMANRKMKGMQTELERCVESAAASCLQLTRSLQEGPRTFCFPQPAQCERANQAAASRDDVESLVDCEVYR